jgi:hypothetical protein
LVSQGEAHPSFKKVTPRDAKSKVSNDNESKSHKRYISLTNNALNELERPYKNTELQKTDDSMIRKLIDFSVSYQRKEAR